MDLSLEQETLRLSSEAQLVAALRTTYQIKAPVEMTYLDGSPIKRHVMDRIHRKVLASNANPG
jgi:hypothetical protein